MATWVSPRSREEAAQGVVDRQKKVGTIIDYHERAVEVRRAVAPGDGTLVLMQRVLPFTMFVTFHELWLVCRFQNVYAFAR